jgi:hypothetical protein
MRNSKITNSKEMIVEAIYNYRKENGMKVDGNSVKLTQLLASHFIKSNRNDLSTVEFTAISYYYLLFLMDNGFIVIDVKSILPFSKHNEFKWFVEKF